MYLIVYFRETDHKILQNYMYIAMYSEIGNIFLALGYITKGTIKTIFRFIHIILL